jgi:hypothetical protein
MYGTGRGGKGHVGVVDSRDDANFLDLHATSSLSEGGGGSRLRSATLVGLDVEIQELSAQIDAFMHERDKLSKFVATRWQRVSPPREEEDILSSSPLVFAPVSEVGDDNQSRYQEADSVVEVCPLLYPWIVFGFADRCTLPLSRAEKILLRYMETIGMEGLRTQEWMNSACLHGG